MINFVDSTHGVAARSAEFEERDIRLMDDAGIVWIWYGDFNFDPVAFAKGRFLPEAVHTTFKRLHELHAWVLNFIATKPGPREMAQTDLVPGSDGNFQARRT
ncbi:hypothetical protein [Cerasicoccus fimbriatus]|uniref:hypothetical protein n=1 Tax=Cerasicoccus fimbriatus TaxID=3014554 RepID=UPI0022B3A5B9|nr:hypothetical protein [Cerasicoccus sp. TK19100]